MKLYILILFILFNTKDLSAQNDSSLTDVSWFPLIGYSPETKALFGAVGNVLFKKSEEDVKPTSMSPIFVYSTKQQYTIGLFTDIYSDNKKHHTETAFEYSKFPNSIFAASSDVEEHYTPKSLILGAIYSYEFQKDLYAGVRYIYKSYTMKNSEVGGVVSQLFNKEHNHLSGFGFQTIYDSRNHLFAPNSGLFTTLSWTNYGDIIGSKSSFSAYEMNHNHYFGINDKLIFAYQTNISLKFGDVPFYELNALGSNSSLRGYHSGKYYGKDKFSFQGEFRQSLYDSYELVLFAGMGNTANEVEDSFSNLKGSFGVGFRYFLDEKNKIPLRIDLAWGENGSSGVYISLLQAF